MKQTFLLEQLKHFIQGLVVFEPGLAGQRKGFDWQGLLSALHISVADRWVRAPGIRHVVWVRFDGDFEVEDVAHILRKRVSLQKKLLNWLLECDKKPQFSKHPQNSSTIVVME